VQNVGLRDQVIAAQLVAAQKGFRLLLFDD